MAESLRWISDFGKIKTSASHTLTTAHHLDNYPLTGTTHYVLAEAHFEAFDDIEESYEDPGRDFKTNVSSFLSDLFPCKSDRRATHEWLTAHRM